MIEKNGVQFKGPILKNLVIEFQNKYKILLRNIFEILEISVIKLLIDLSLSCIYVCMYYIYIYMIYDIDI